MFRNTAHDMNPDFQHDAFLSHNQADKLRVRRLAERLRAAGLRVWFDEWIIQPGECPSPVGRERVAVRRVRDQKLAIERGLETTRTLALCLSAAALGSDWVELERGAVGRGNLPFRDPTNADRRFIPLLLADCKLPDTLRWTTPRAKFPTATSWARTARSSCRAQVSTAPTALITMDAHAEGKGVKIFQQLPRT